MLKSCRNVIISLFFIVQEKKKKDRRTYTSKYKQQLSLDGENNVDIYLIYLHFFFFLKMLVVVQSLSHV